MTTARAFVGLGANLGDARAAIERARDELDAIDATRVVALSSIYRSAPVDAEGPDYLNAVAELRTALAPHELLEAMRAIEQRHGRVRGARNAPRTLDLDLLLYGDAVLSDPQLTVPHPRLRERAFVLRPLAELDSQLRIPGAPPLDELLSACAGQRAEPIAEPIAAPVH